MTYPAWFGRAYGHHEPLCADCDGIGDHRCEYHQEKYDDAVLGDVLNEFEGYLYDEMPTELWLFEIGSFA